MVRIVVALFALLAVLFATVGAQAQSEQSLETARWTVYGTTSAVVADGQVPGNSALNVAAPATAGELWSSGVGMAVPMALKAGETVSGIFWGRAEQPTRVLVTLQAAAAPYTGFGQAVIALTPTWQRFTIAGAAPSDSAAGSQNLVLHLGKLRTNIALGPVAFRAVGLAAGDRATSPPPPQTVTIASAPGVTLEGTLQMPAGRGPFPLVVFFAGTGPNPRGGFVLLANRLHAEGIATFDYDKRGVGKSTGVYDDSIPLTQADGAAAVRAMRKRPGIDGARIAVCGLSQGGVTGPLIAADDPQVAAVVMLAGPVGARGDMFLGGMRTTLRQSGKRSPAVVDRIVEVVRDWMDARSAKQPAEKLAVLRAAAVSAFASEGATTTEAEGAVAVLDMPLLLSMYEFDPIETLARIKVPVLAVYAEKDTVIKTAESISAAKAALRKNPDATIVEIPGANHTFQDLESGIGYPVAIPQVLDLVTAWLVKRLHPVMDK